MKVVATNKKAGRDYELGDRLEAGLALMGTEIKSIRARHVSLAESFVRIDGGEAWLMNAHIAPYDPASRMNHEPLRPRKLLLHRREIDRLFEKIRQQGFTVVPTRMYIERGRAKVEIALAKGKKKYDKRQAIAKRDAERDVARVLARKGR